ncbi:MAG: ImmA/IrrE family metallo-endopeptidase [Spirochaetes bacterium]|nr:MAG: ImmA/IrrE family metallo-endopeptidase [Spirochaetota bacterium]
MERGILSDNLRRLRSIKGINQTELAKKAGLSRPSYVAIEKGDTDPRSSTLMNIAGALEVSLADLFRPLPSLKRVRFRIRKTMTKREQNQRDQLIQDVAVWLSDYNELEKILGHGRKYLFESYAGRDPVQAASFAREKLKIGENELIRDVCGLAETAGIKVNLSKAGFKKFFGMSVSVDNGGPAVCVKVGDDVSVERQIFTVAHEMGHLLLHRNSYKKDETSENEKEERNAERFASHFLIPQSVFDKEWQSARGLHLVDRVLHVKRIFRVSYMTVLIRLVECGYADLAIIPAFRFEYNRLCGHDLKSHYEPESYSETEPEGLVKSDFMDDRLYRLVREAYEKELISLDRAAEILRLSVIEMRELNNSWKMAV